MAGAAAGNWLGEQATGIAGGQVGNPVDVTSGRKMLLSDTETDFVWDAPLAVVVDRFYASDLDAGSSLGQGWRLPWEQWLQVGDDGVQYSDRQGRVHPLPLVPVGEKLWVDSELNYLSHVDQNRWIISGLDETHSLFVPAAEQTGLFLLYQTEDSLGSAIRYHRDEQGLVSQIEHNAGLKLSLHYQTVDEDPRLVRIEQTAGGSVGDWVYYDYNSQGQLIQMRDRQQHMQRQFDWGKGDDDRGLLVAHRNAEGLECTYRWQPIDGQARVVEHRTHDGEHYQFAYDFAQRRCRVTDLSIAEQPSHAEWQWDEAQNITACRYFDGLDYRFDYNELNHLLALHLPSEADQPRTVTLEYDELGRVIAETSPQGLRSEREFAPDSLRILRETLPNGATWRATFEPQTGVILVSEDPLGHKTHYQWETPYGPSRIENALGKTTQLQWNSRGQLLHYTDCSGKTDDYAYDGDGQLIAQRNALGETEHYQYDSAGRLQTLIHADGSRQHYSWNDLGQLLAHTDTAGQQQHWQYNTRGQIEQHRDAAGFITQALYNPRQQLIGLQKGQALHRMVWDSAGRLLAECQPDGVEHHYHYNTAGQLQRRDTLGATQVDQAPASRPQRSRHYRYDLDGRLCRYQSASTQHDYSYSPLGQLIQAIRQPDPDAQAGGQREQQLTFDYDPLGRLLTETGPHGSVRYQWDALSNLKSLTLPQGQVLNYQRYGSGHVHGMTLDQYDLGQFERDDLHREILRSQGALNQRSHYDARGRLSRQTCDWAKPQTELTAPPAATPQPLHWRDYRYNAAGQLSLIDDPLRGSQSYHYDPAGRLLSHQAFDYSQQFQWDAADNHSARLQGSPPSAQSLPGNRLMQHQVQDRHGAQPRNYRYDAYGRLIEKRADDAHGVQQLIWDDEDQLIEIRDRRGITRFDYDPLGRRIGKHHQPHTANPHRPEPGRSTHFVWEGLRLLQEHDLEHNRIRSWFYQPTQAYSPLACCDQYTTKDADSPLPAKLYYAHTDHLGTIQELTDAEGNIAWSARYSAWGNRLGSADIPLDRQAAVKTDCQLRFQGQYFDTETGLHYNTFRYYDPDCGRFISPDPIGVAGGWNLYQYAPNPVEWVDPWGWSGFDPFSAGELTSFPEDLHFGQDRIAPNFSTIGSQASNSIVGRPVLDVAADIKAGRISPNELLISYTIDPKTGKAVTLNNRGLAALVESGKIPDHAIFVPYDKTPPHLVADIKNRPPSKSILITKNKNGSGIIKKVGPGCS
jgi:RHS repeat-associated protein